jgi:hypothetical protein
METTANRTSHGGGGRDSPGQTKEGRCLRWPGGATCLEPAVIVETYDEGARGMS